MGGFNSSSTDTSFARNGSTLSTKSYNLPSYIHSLIYDNAWASRVDPALANKQGGAMMDLMDTSAKQYPGDDKLTSIMNQDPKSYVGSASLESMGARNPFSNTYENNTDSAFKQRAADAMAQVGTGPDAVRGGSARTGIAQGTMATQLAQMRGKEIRDAQSAEAPIVLGAISQANKTEQDRNQSSLAAASGLNTSTGQRGQLVMDSAKTVDNSKLLNLQTLELASKLQGAMNAVQTENYSGAGSQGSFSGGLGADCCFIFLQALNGKLPWFIELARWEYYTPVRRRGYRWMAKWLVPQMAKRLWVAQLVNVVIIRPFLKYGAWLYKVNGDDGMGKWLAPYCQAWLHLWGTLGCVVGEVKI